MEATPISTAVLARALKNGLEEHDTLRNLLKKDLSKVLAKTKEGHTLSGQDFETMKTELNSLLTRSNHASKAYQRIEDACLGKTDEIDTENPWSVIYPDLRAILEGHLEDIALEGATAIVKEAKEKPTEGAPIIEMGRTATAIWLLSGEHPKENLREYFDSDLNPE